MKKIIMILVVFISSIIFYNGYINISQKQYNDVINISYTYAQQTNMQVIPIDLQLSENQQERIEQFNKVYDFLKEHHYACFVSMTAKDVNTEYIYVPTNNHISIYTQEGKMIDFSTPSKHYLSSSYKDKQRYATIDFIDPSYHKDYNTIYRIKDFSNYILDWNGNTLFPLYFVTNSKTELLENLQNAGISSELKVDGDITTSDFSLTNIDYSFLIRILMYLIIAVFLCLLSSLLSSRKEVLIRKMQGASSWFIYKRLYGKLYILSTLLFGLIQIVLYVCIVQNIRSVNWIFIKYLLNACILFAVSLLSVGTILYVILNRIQSVLLLKKEQLKWTTTALYGLKCVFMISICIPLLTSFSYTTQVIKDGYYLKKYENNFCQYLHLEGINMNMFSMNFNDAIQNINEKIRKYPYIYEDFSTKMGRDGEVIETPYVFVNKEFLKDYTLYKDGKAIKAFKTGTLYMPKSVSMNENVCLADSCEVEYIDDGYILVSHSVSSENIYAKNPIIYVVDDNDEMDLFNIYVKDEDKKIKNYIDNYLKSKKLYQNVNFTYENHNYSKKTNLIRKLIIDSTILLFIYVLVLFLFQYQTTYLYFLENNKRISLDCLLGKSVWKKYKYFILINSMIYIILTFWIIFLIKQVFTHILLVICIAIFIDFVMFLLFQSYFEKKKVLLALKGDQL